MSNLQELKNTVQNPLLLLKEIKNSGVEFKKLGEVGIFYSGLSGKNKYDFINGNAKFISYKNVFNNMEIDLNINDTVKVNENESQNTIKYADVLFTGSSETLEESGMSSVVTSEPQDNFYLNSFCFGLRFFDNIKILPQFSKYLFRASHIRKQIIKCSQGVTRYNLSKKKMENIEIPIPPLEVQAEIVRILDTFTKDVNELIDLLKREQELRKKQYSYYLDKFTTIENSDIVKLKDVAIYRKERLKREFLTEDNYISVENLLKDRAGKIKSSNLPSVDSVIKYEKEDILIGNIRPYLKKIWFSDCIGGTNGDVLAIGVTNKEKVYPKYLYYILSSDTFFSYDVKHSQCGKMPRGRKDMILEFTFKLPPIDTQKRIVDILDNFERYTNDLQEGLPAEIEKRKKQYAYYRDELLRFERK